MIPDRFSWMFFRRTLLRIRLPHFKAHLTSYATADSIFEDYVSLKFGTGIYSSFIGFATYVDGAKISFSKIGRYCSIGPGVRIGIEKHPINYISTHPAFYSDHGQTMLRINELKELDQPILTEIGNDVWIGAHALIMSGVQIGNGAIVGANSVVTKDVPPYAIVAGVPARVIRYRFKKEIIDKFQRIEWWNMSNQDLKRFVNENAHHGVVDEEKIINFK